MHRWSRGVFAVAMTEPRTRRADGDFNITNQIKHIKQIKSNLSERPTRVCSPHARGDRPDAHRRARTLFNNTTHRTHRARASSSRSRRRERRWMTTRNAAHGTSSNSSRATRALSPRDVRARGAHDSIRPSANGASLDARDAQPRDALARGDARRRARRGRGVGFYGVSSFIHTVVWITAIRSRGHAILAPRARVISRLFSRRARRRRSNAPRAFGARFGANERRRSMRARASRAATRGAIARARLALD